MDFTQAIPFWLFITLAALGVIGMFLSLRREPGVKDKTSNEPSTKPSNKESGNALFAIFGALALVGVLSASMMTFMKGPLATSIKLTKMNTAESQMTIGAQVAVMATAAQANNGDCDLDGYVEPMEWRTATVEPIPTGGGLVPLSLGISKKDPWGTEYGYCVWNHGPTLSGSGCAANMLGGYNSNANTVVALISAGPDKAFTTTCRDFATADVVANGVLTDPTDLPLVSKAAETDDDIITSFTYQEATGASGGLWNLKAADPSTAVINKKIETTGSANFAGGILLPDKALITCDATNAGVMAKTTAAGGGIEICDGAGGWTAVGGGGAATGFDPAGTCVSMADAGKVRYNSVSGQPEFCNGTQWLPFTINTPGVNLVITPNNQNAMNVDGSSNQDTSTCTIASGMTCGASVTFTVTNQGTLNSAVPSIRIVQTTSGVTSTITGATLTNSTNASNFVVLSNTCTAALTPNGTCTVVVRPKASGNISYTADLRVIGDNNPIALMQGIANNFGCVPGRQAGGGRYAACNLTDSATGSTYDLVVQPSGCSGSTNNPTCTGGTDTFASIFGSSCCNNTQCREFGGWWCGNNTDGARNSVDIFQISTLKGYTSNAVAYCMNLNLNGYSDWYLPARAEMQAHIFPNRAAIGGFQNAQYWASCYGSTSDACSMDMASGNQNGQLIGTVSPVRCARRDNIPLPADKVYDNPADISVRSTISFTPSSRATSSAFTVGGVTVPVTISISGGVGDPKLRVNGGSEVSSASVTIGQTVQFVMDTPSVLGTKNTATINWGPTKIYSWWVGYADAAREARAFVTSSTWKAGWLGGIFGADSACRSVAASSSYGLSSDWKAIMSTSSVDAADRLPWTWGILKTVTGVNIVNGGISDLLDGTFDGPINVNQSGAGQASSVWTGTDSAGLRYYPSQTTSQYWAYDWTAVNCCGYSPAAYGLSGSTTSGLYQGTTDSESQLAIYCIENVDDAPLDTTPSSFNTPYKIQVPVSSRQTSNAVIIGGMSAGATTTLSVTATGGTPTFTVNGGAEVTSAIVHNGDSVFFLMDAPATDNSNNKMTISSSGPVAIVAYWRVWTGDTTGSLTKRIFINSSGSSSSGIASYDSLCQTKASASSLGGIWKAILSGVSEPEWAINRIGYNWSVLKRVDGVDVVLAGNIWSTNSTPLLATISKTAADTTLLTSGVMTNTSVYGFPNSISSAANVYGGSCKDWTQGYSGSSYTTSGGSSGVLTSQWIYNAATAICETCCGNLVYYYCIEQ